MNSLRQPEGFYSLERESFHIGITLNLSGYLGIK